MQYVADTPDGAWAEFLRLEEIDDPADLAGVARRLWVIELPDDIDDAVPVTVTGSVATGDLGSYWECQQDAAQLRASGARVLRAPSAALRSGGAGGQLTAGGLREAVGADGVVWVLVGTWPQLRGWATVDVGAPTERVLHRVRHLEHG